MENIFFNTKVQIKANRYINVTLGICYKNEIDIKQETLMNFRPWATDCSYIHFKFRGPILFDSKMFSSPIYGSKYFDNSSFIDSSVLRIKITSRIQTTIFNTRGNFYINAQLSSFYAHDVDDFKALFLYGSFI